MFKQSSFHSCGKKKKKKTDKIKRTIVYQPLDEGGLRFVNFSAVVNSLRLEWISRLYKQHHRLVESNSKLLFQYLWWLEIPSQMQL